MGVSADGSCREADEVGVEGRYEGEVVGWIGLVEKVARGAVRGEREGGGIRQVQAL